MTKVAIIPEPCETGGTLRYRAIAGELQTTGATAGAALDALTAQLSDDQSGMLVVVQNSRGDEFFTADQQARLTVLMTSWRQARDTGSSLSVNEQAELDALVAAELDGAGKRATALLRELSP
jgi:hypothetical protein